MCDRIAILHAGRIVELQETDSLFLYPREGLTQRLVSTIISADPVEQP